MGKKMTTVTNNKLRYRPPCASIAIASQGPEEPATFQTAFGSIRSRTGAALQHTAKDAETVLDFWRKENNCLPDTFHRLLMDPKLDEVESTLKDLSRQIDAHYGENIGLDLYFAGHGEENTGNLVLRDGLLTPTQYLDFQADKVEKKQTP